MIENFDEDIWVDTFGIIGINELQKIRFEIGQSREQKLVSQAVYGWGSNTFGQLGLSNISVSQNVPHPRALPIPENIGQISDIGCGKRHSFIFTDKGELWATGNLKEEKNSRLLQIKKDIGGADDEEEKMDLTDPVARKNSLLGNGEVELDFTVKEKHSYKKGKKQKQEKGGKSNKIPKNLIHQQRNQDRQDNKMINDNELSISHRWLCLTSYSKIISNKYQVDSIEAVDQNSPYIKLNVSRRFSLLNGYFVPEIDHEASTSEIKNKWGTKFREVDKIMAWLCYD